jgi:hypothetical protein
VLVSETTLAIELPGNDDQVVRRTTTQAVRSIKGQRPRTANPSVSQAMCRTSGGEHVSRICCRITGGHATEAGP